MNKELNKIVAELNERLLENHKNDTGLFAKSTEIQSELGLLYDDRPTCPFLRPHFMSRSRYDEVAAAAHHIAKAAQNLSDAALETPEIFAKLDLTEKEDQMARINPG